MDWIARSLRLIKRRDVPIVDEGEVPVGTFRGRWDERHPLNAPGRYYGAGTDTCCDGPALAPASLLYDHEGAGFVWRQPRDETELGKLIEGAESDPFVGYADDGDSHWTPQLVRTWWANRVSRQPLVDALVRDLTGPRPALPTEFADLRFRCLPIGGYTDDERAQMASIVEAYLLYIESGLERDLREYIYYLENGTPPKANDTLPTL